MVPTTISIIVIAKYLSCKFKFVTKCLNCRLAGVTLVVPVINYWWPSFPPELKNEAYKKQLKRDQCKLRIAHYAPALLYWWMTQKFFPYSSILQRHPIILNKRDLQTVQKMSQEPMPNEVLELHKN